MYPYKNYVFLFALLSISLFYACQDDLSEIGDLTAPTNLTIDATVANDGSGIVNFKSKADGAITYHYFFGLSDNEDATVSSSGNIEFAYRTSGDYSVRVIAFGPGGVASNTSTDISVEVVYEAPSALLQTLSGGSSRRWLWHKAVIGHLGVGPLLDANEVPVGEPIWYMAQPFEKESDGCLYEDIMIFTQNSDNTLSYELQNNDNSYFNRGEVNSELGEAAPDNDRCYAFDASGSKSIGFFESASGLTNTTNISFTLGNKGFISYFLGSSEYEILSYSADEISLRCIQTDDAGAQFAWYIKLIAEDASGGGGNEKEYELVWADEFDVAGAPDAAKWGYDLGTGQNGWGNGESQTYTDRADNVIVEDGVLKIIAKRENINGAQFSSARVKSQDKFEFTYGKIEINAKLPTGGGTWPALWLLGADFETNTWPAAGEMDIMEHVGNNQDVVQSAVHSPSSFGGTINKGDIRVNGVSADFHLYELEWTADGLKFGVDGNNYYTYNPGTKNDDTYPFNKDFFFILNVAMGGSLGGAIDNAFTESIMEVDYIRVYQEK